MKSARYEGELLDLESHLNSITNKIEEITILKKKSEKGAFSCPYCGEIMILRSGSIRDVHFAHRHSKACDIAVAYNAYYQQIKNEAKTHSLIKEHVFNDLKKHEVYGDVTVSNAFEKKAQEKWKHYPDILMEYGDREYAISILTDVTNRKDAALVKSIQKRNAYFESKKLVPIWLIENNELSIDIDKHVMHLWEAEVFLSSKTEQDVIWDKELVNLNSRTPIFYAHNYFQNDLRMGIDVRSLYYVSLQNDNLIISIIRFILDSKSSPFKSFVLNKGYQIKFSDSLAFGKTIELCNKDIESENREEFKRLTLLKHKERSDEDLKQEELRRIQEEEDFRLRREEADRKRELLKKLLEGERIKQEKEIEKKIESRKVQMEKDRGTQVKEIKNYNELKEKLRNLIGMNQSQQLELWHKVVLGMGIKDFDYIWHVAHKVNDFDELILKLKNSY